MTKQTNKVKQWNSCARQRTKSGFEQARENMGDAYEAKKQYRKHLFRPLFMAKHCSMINVDNITIGINRSLPKSNDPARTCGIQTGWTSQRHASPHLLRYFPPILCVPSLYALLSPHPYFRNVSKAFPRERGSPWTSLSTLHLDRPRIP